jgi:hypothetical protein
MARYTVKFVAGERQGSLLVLLSPSQPCSALCDAVRKRRNDLNLDGVEATLHLEDADGPELYPADALSDVLPGAKETVVVVFQVSTRICSLSRQSAPLLMDIPCGIRSRLASIAYNARSHRLTIVF